MFPKTKDYSIYTMNSNLEDNIKQFAKTMNQRVKLREEKFE